MQWDQNAIFVGDKSFEISKILFLIWLYVYNEKKSWEIIKNDFRSFFSYFINSCITFQLTFYNNKETKSSIEGVCLLQRQRLRNDLFVELLKA